jgi:HSP20 family protein
MNMANGSLTPWRPRSLVSGGPFGGGSLGTGSLFDLHRQMNRLFDDLFEGGGSSGGRAGGGLSAPALDVHTDERQIEITAELPGVKQEDIELTVEDGVLTLSGEKKSERKDENGYSERSYGRFERRITLPSNVDEEQCSADFKDGVLHITLPRTEAKSRGRRIPLGGGGAQQQRPEAQNDSNPTSRQEAAQESDRQGQKNNQQR